MILDRPSLKARAAHLMRTCVPSVIVVSLLYIALTAIFGYLSGRIMGGKLTEEAAAQWSKYLTDGNYEYAMQYLETLRPPASAYAVDFLLTVVMSIVGAGYIIFLLNSIRSTGACAANLLDGFSYVLKIIVLNLLEGVFIMLWSLLLIVPGIIAAYKYSMAIYLLMDHPEKTPMECIRESGRMMQGHKGELFVLDLSFIGWKLLELLPLVGYCVRIWSVPYYATTKALYYEQLCGKDVSGTVNPGVDYYDNGPMF